MLRGSDQKPCGKLLATAVCDCVPAVTRRVVLLVCSIAVIAGAAGCGSSSPKPLTAAQTKLCVVRVFFDRGAARAQERFVAAKLRSDKRVARLVFTSKAQALARMKKAEPDLFKHSGLVGNPLPDSYTATPAQLTDLPPLGRAVSSAHWPGVQDVHWGSSLQHSLCGGGSP